MKAFFKLSAVFLLPVAASFAVPFLATALSVDASNYAVGAPVNVTCGVTTHNYEVYDITAGIDGAAGQGGDIGNYTCAGTQTLTFSSINAHTYSILELDRSTSCASQDYTQCAIQASTWSEINFTVGTGATAGAVGYSSFPLSTNKKTYTVGEPFVVTCSYARGNFEVYDVSTGISGLIAKGGNLGLFQCSNSTATLSTVDGHSYAVIELAPGQSCEADDYDACSSETFSRDEVDVTVAGTGGGTPTTPGFTKDTYGPTETPLLTCTVGSDVFDVYDITQGVDGLVSNGGYIGHAPCGTPAALAFALTPGHSYAAEELSNGMSCSGMDYSVCLQQGFARSTFFFKISFPYARRVISYPPEVTISAPTAGSVFSTTTAITYAVTDQNDIDPPEIKAELGLGDHPVSIYYSDKISSWDHEFVSPDDKVLVTNSLAATGTYSWDISALKPGVAYRVIVDALDNGNNLGEYVSDPFYVDFTPPQFIVSTDPTITRGEDVTITVEPNEKLQAPPKVSVTQEGGSASDVAMSLKDDVYQGIYKVVGGEDGIAHISVEGTDLAGNVGTTTLSGGTFAVGVNPPPTPHILSPKKNSIVSTSTVTITGTTKPGTSIVLVVNGKDTYAATSTKNGAFSVSNIGLSKTFNHGLNTISVAAKDITNALSAPATLQIKYNIPPTISLVSPKPEAILRGVDSIVASSTDQNNDPLQYTYQIISEKDYDPMLPASSTKNAWIPLAEGISSNKVSWDTTEEDDGVYYFRAIVTDGTARAYSEARRITVHNTLPYFRFIDGRKTIVQRGPVTVSGRVLEPETLSANISTVEYSLDSGRTWIPVQITPGAPTAQFSVQFPTMQNEGTYGVLWRAKDSRGLIGRTSHPVLIDATAPKPPVIVSPRGTTITDDNDEDTTKEGAQISVSVQAEPSSKVVLSVDGATSTERADNDGSAVFREITLTRGAHTFSAIATDEAGNTSAPTSRVYIYDNPPEVSFLEPKPSRGLTGVAKVSWRTDDPDNDPVHTYLQYRKGRGAFTTLTADAPQNAFLWDVHAFSEGGDYELRLIASDGLASSTETIGFFIDKTPPTLDAFKLDATALGAKSTLSGKGTASDALSGVEYVEYAVSPQHSNDPKEWYTGLITKGYLKKQAAFSIKSPLKLADGPYEVSVRAVDAAGNTSEISTTEITVDTTPPRIGSFLGTTLGLQISPDKDGLLSLYADSDFTLGVSLENDTASSSVAFEGRTYPLMHDVASGLWQAQIHTGSEGVSPITISARDRLGNAVKNIPLGKVSTHKHGQVFLEKENVPQPMRSGEIQVLSLQKETGRFRELSRVQVRDDGSYELALPPGEYRLVFYAVGYQTVQKDVLYERPTLVSEDFITKKISNFQEVMQDVFSYLQSL